MKKTLVTLLALVFVLSIASAALAAPANPFVDVPAKHWAYGAVAKLAKAGVVDGYGDGTFRGDRTMTRYEMAQMVAKAMAKSEKADAEMKALIDKLAVEFAAELNNLGVRVAKLEAKNNVGLSFESRLRFYGNDAKSVSGSNQFDMRQRIYLSGAVNDKVTYGARIQTENSKFGQNTNGTSAGDNGFSMNRMFFNIADFAGIDKLTIGRFPTLFVTNGLLNGSTNGIDGVMVTEKMGDVTFKGFYANAAKAADVQVGLYNFDFSVSKDVNFNAAYQTVNGAVKTNSVDVGIQAKFGEFWLKGEYVNTKDKTTATQVTAKAFGFEISNSVTPYFASVTNIVNPMKAHTDAVALGYRSVEPNATPVVSSWAGNLGTLNASMNGFDNNVKGWYLQYQNVLSKGLVFSFDYTDLKQKVGTEKDKVWQSRLEFYF